MRLYASFSEEFLPSEQPASKPICIRYPSRRTTRSARRVHRLLASVNSSSSSSSSCPLRGQNNDLRTKRCARCCRDITQGHRPTARPVGKWRLIIVVCESEVVGYQPSACSMQCFRSVADCVMQRRDCA